MVRFAELDARNSRRAGLSRRSFPPWSPILTPCRLTLVRRYSPADSRIVGASTLSTLVYYIRGRNEEILGDPLLANGNDCFPVVASRQGGADFLMCSCASNGGSDQEDLEPWPVLPKHPAISYEPGYRRRIRARARIPVASRAAALGSGTDGVTGPTSTSPLVCGGPGSLTAFISYRKRPKRSPSG